MKKEHLENIKSLITLNINEARTFPDLELRIVIIQEILNHMKNEKRMVYPVKPLNKKDKLY
jgi:hypothetical protein